MNLKAHEIAVKCAGFVPRAGGGFAGPRNGGTLTVRAKVPDEAFG
jgi:hypothetical protein